MNANPLDHQSALQEWREKEKQALELSKLVGELRFDRSIEIVLFRRDLFDIRPSEIINIHLFSKNYIDKPITVDLTLSIVKVISHIPDLNPSKIDIGRLAAEWETDKSKLAAFITDLEKALGALVAKINNLACPYCFVMVYRNGGIMFDYPTEFITPSIFIPACEL